MATLEELLAEKARRTEGAAAPVAPTGDLEALMAEKARRQEVQSASLAEVEPSPFPMEPGTSRAAQELPELMDVSGFLEGREQAPPSAELEAAGLGGVEQAVTGAGEELSQAWLNMTTLDPSELGQQIAARFPDVGVQYAPDGTVIVANNKTGKKVVVNRPGISPMDILQGIGMIGAYSPASRVVSAVKGTGKKILTGMAGAGATEGVLQAGQEAAGGTFDEGDIALSAGLGAVPEVVVGPLVTAASKLKDVVKGSSVPGNVKQAIEFAKEQGKKITSSDAMEEFVTPTMQIFLKVAQRIPWVGTGKIGKKQQRERAEALSEVAKKFDINVETEFGTEIMDSFVKRMMNKRFWGKNKNPTPEQISKAFEREGDEITDSLLSRYIRKGNIDEEVVDRVLDSGNSNRVREMLGRLDENGQAAAKQRFIANGLEKAGWRPEAPQVADPRKFMEYLDTPGMRKTAKIMFSEQEQNLLSGTREYLRLTTKAGEESGAGMIAAGMGGGFLGLTYLAGIATSAVSGLGTAYGARLAQSDKVRDLLLRLVHAKGNDKKVKAIMEQLRPAVIAGSEQMTQEDLAPNIDVEITDDMVKGGAEKGYDDSMKYLRSLGTQAMDKASGLSGRLQEMLSDGG